MQRMRCLALATTLTTVRRAAAWSSACAPGPGRPAVRRAATSSADSPAAPHDPSKPRSSRLRQHLNPLSQRWRTPIVLAHDYYDKMFAAPEHPLWLDIGSAKGGFAIDVATARGEINILGLEIRPEAVKFALDRLARRGGPPNVAFLQCNANVDLDSTLAPLADAATGEVPRLERVLLQFPDPHFKRRHRKRRVIDGLLVHTVAARLPQGGDICLTSDILEVAVELRAAFRAAKGFNEMRDDGGSGAGWLAANTVGVPTEREVAVENNGLPVYRCRFVRNGEPVAADTIAVVDQAITDLRRFEKSPNPP